MSPILLLCRSRIGQSGRRLRPMRCALPATANFSVICGEAMAFVPEHFRPLDAGRFTFRQQDPFRRTGVAGAVRRRPLLQPGAILIS